MKTQIAQEVHGELSKMCDVGITRLDPLDTLIPWPGQPRQLWPRADISAALVSGDKLIVEIDDHADPGRSITKYWPLLHSAHHGVFYFPRVLFVEISNPDSTFGEGYDILPKFIGERFHDMFPERFLFRYLELKNRSPNELAADIVRFVREHCADP